VTHEEDTRRSMATLKNGFSQDIRGGYLQKRGIHGTEKKLGLGSNQGSGKQTHLIGVNEKRDTTAGRGISDHERLMGWSIRQGGVWVC